MKLMAQRTDGGVAKIMRINQFKINLDYYCIRIKTAWQRRLTTNLPSLACHFQPYAVAIKVYSQYLPRASAGVRGAYVKIHL